MTPVTPFYGFSTLPLKNMQGLYFGPYYVCSSQLSGVLFTQVPNHTNPRTQNHAAGPENDDHGLASLNEAMLKLAHSTWDSLE